MRKIKYRGKSIQTGEWVYGYPYGKNAIIALDSEYTNTSLGTLITSIYEVNPSTVGQLTGLHDTTPEKAELWQDDIVEHGEMPYQVVWNNEQGYWAARPLITTEQETMLFWLIDEGDCVKVGNVHENPELLGV